MEYELVVGVCKPKGLKVKTKEGKYIVRFPGELIPEAGTWKPNVLQSHLSLKWIQTESEYKMTSENAKMLVGSGLTRHKQLKGLLPQVQKKPEQKKATPKKTVESKVKAKK